ncbi:LamG domain-containing protein [Candidatus Poribacteria bacterium]
MQRCFLRPIFVSWNTAILALLFLLSGPTYAGISGIWLFDEDRGDEVLDLSGNDNHGTINGGVEWKPDGKFGGALLFNGSDGWVEIPNSASLIPPEITIVAWIYLDNVIGNHAIAEKYDWQAGKGSFVLRTGPVLGAGAGNDLSFMFIVGTTDPPPLATAQGILVDTEWIHVAGTIDGSLVKLFVNGEEAAVTEFDSEMLPSDTSLSLGSRGDTKDIHWHAGLMDEVAILDEALPETEIKKIMQSGLQSYMAVHPKSKLSVAWGAVKSGF